MKITDVAFFTDASFVRATEEARRAHVPIRNRVDIIEGVFIQQLARELWQKIADACTLAGLSDGTRQFTQLYAFVREFAEEIDNQHRILWDHDERLQICLGLSRLVYPTSISFEYSARIISEDDSVLEILPGPANGFGAKAWLPREEYRDWLTESDARDVSAIASAYFSPDSRLCVRAKQALWYLEYAYRTYFLDIRWPLICMGLESFVHTDKFRSTSQFAKRVPKIAENAGISDFSEDQAREAYDLRSALAHGQLLRDIGEYKLDIYEKIEHILRLVIRKAILDPSFNSVFNSDDSIRKLFPI